MRRILVVNDDGLHGDGLEPLRAALAPLGNVTVLVPERERSAASHCLTLHKPLRLRLARPGIHTLNGTPADCARFGILHMLRPRCDLVVSGINRGHNLGQDVVYSGTVAAAMEGTLLGVPSLAVSQGLRRGRADYQAAASFAALLAKRVLRGGLPRGVCLNVNVPPRPAERLKGWKAARLGERVYDKTVTMRTDPRGDAYFWLAGRRVSGLDVPGTDVAAVKDGFISVTPLRLDATDPRLLPALGRWRL
ncbi:MAG: 5'/3'-nucleotidase SurE [Elusimicrobia bacterium]|nr:5'/3'-nucleotidase SurE [Elusimicrobiota bacterium]